MMIREQWPRSALAFVYAKGKAGANGDNAYSILYKNIEDRLKEIGLFAR